jgi:metal-sulfur cluster biosynthetic enzyme
MPTERAVRERLGEVVDPCSAANGTDLSVVEMGLIDDVEVDGGEVTVAMHLTSPLCTQIPYFVEEIEERVGALDGVASVDLETDGGFTWHRDMMSEHARRERQQRRRDRAQQYDDADMWADAAATGAE